MIPLVLIAIGLALLGVGFAILRSFGPRYRVGRLLAATPSVSIPEAIALADGPPRYVAVRGRIDAEDEFEDEHHRPLVLRRARIQQAHGSAWETIDEHLQAVTFGIREGLDAIGVDHEVLDDGLVAVPREAVGRASEIPERLPPDIPADATVRLRVDLVSAVEHAIVVGVPARRPDGLAVMTAGLGRPLILTTLEPGEAMRVLTEGGERRPLAAALAFAAGAVAIVAGLAWGIVGAATATVAAATPSATPGVAGDPRSSGSGPGLVGDPLVAIAIVVAIGLGATLVTLGYIRLTSGRRPS